MSDGFAEPGLTAEALAATPRGLTAGQATERLRTGRPQQGSEASPAVSVAPAGGADDAFLRRHALGCRAARAGCGNAAAGDRDRRRCVAERHLRVRPGVSRRSGRGKAGRPVVRVPQPSSRRRTAGQSNGPTRAWFAGTPSCGDAIGRPTTVGRQLGPLGWRPTSAARHLGPLGGGQRRLPACSCAFVAGRGACQVDLGSDATGPLPDLCPVAEVALGCRCGGMWDPCPLEPSQARLGS